LTENVVCLYNDNNSIAHVGVFSFLGIDCEVSFFREMTAAFAFYRTLWEASTASKNEKNHILPFSH
jgi:hypothetical protein